VYLEGIFSGNLEINQVLPMESNRFVSVDAEFLNMMRKVYKSPQALDVVQISNFQKSMDRLYELLSSIQKSLGEYLEKERSNFPRFYFLGDEDLLEILGNSSDIHRIMPHFKKMFGFTSVNFEGTMVLSVTSKDGEIVSTF
jgi:dynein heavy chain 1, cytosolic